MLRNGKIVLCPLDDKDAPVLTALANNKKIADNLRDSFPFPYSLENAVFFISLVKREKPSMTFAIEFEGSFCGVIGRAPQPDIYRKAAEIGYWMGEPFWGKGIATQAVELMTSHAFNELNFARLYGHLFKIIRQSMKVLEKCGYKKEGVFDKAVFKKGRI